LNPKDLANPNCEACEGSGICEYVEPYTSGENTIEDLCDTCPQLKGLSYGDFEPEYDEDE